MGMGGMGGRAGCTGWCSWYPHGFDVDRAVNCTDIRAFDDAITRISFGFDTVDDYYATCSSANKIHRVCIPLLCIQVGRGALTAPIPSSRRRQRSAA